MTAALRAALLGLLGLSLLLAPRMGADAGEEVVRVQSLGPGDGRLGELLARPRPPIVVREGAGAPSLGELQRLAALAARAPVVAVLPGDGDWLAATLPAATRAARSAALRFSGSAEPGERVLARLSEVAAGGQRSPLDSVEARAARDGRFEGAFRVRPARAGWHDYLVEARGRTADAGAWARSARPVRVLALTGPPGWESRYALRALEEAGAEVEADLPLGAGERAGSAPPSPSQRLADFDVVLVFPGAEPGRATLRAIRAHVEERGGGALLVGAGPGLGELGLAGASGPEAALSSAAIRWSAPPEIAPLPPTEPALQAAAAPLRELRAGAVAAARADGGVLLALRPLGPGRAGALALTESWRWRLEGGAEGEHRDFWGSLVEWLAGASDDGARLTLPEAVHAPGQPLEVLLDGSTAPPEAVALTRPDGAAERLPLEPAGDGAWRALFVATRPGVHSLGIEAAALASGVADAGEPLAAARVRGPESEPAHGWAELALLAHGSGGAALPAAAVAAWLEDRGADARTSPPGWLWALLFAMALGLACAEWAVRRLSGGP